MISKNLEPMVYTHPLTLQMRRLGPSLLDMSGDHILGQEVVW